MHWPLLQEQRLQEAFETQQNIPIYSVLRWNHVMPLDAKRHQNTAALSIHGVVGGGWKEMGNRWRGTPHTPQSSVQPSAAVNWRRVAISDALSVCFPVDKRSVRGNPPLKARCCLGHEDSERTVLIACTEYLTSTWIVFTYFCVCVYMYMMMCMYVRTYIHT